MSNFNHSQPSRESSRWCLRAAAFAGALLWLGITGQPLLAGGGPEKVLLVVNSESASSKLIANHYIALRKIPTRNVVYLDGVPNRETTNLETFKSKILLPIFSQMKARKLDKSIDYIVYSADFPTSISIHEHRKQLFQKIRVQRKLAADAKVPGAQFYGARASINALTYFSFAVLTDRAGYMALDANDYYRVPARDLLRVPFVDALQIEYQQAIAAYNRGPGKAFDEAIVTLTRMAAENPGQVAVSYSLARFYAKRGDIAGAVRWLTTAVQNGWVYRGETLKDEAFEKVRINPLFSGLENHIADRPYDFSPSRGFKHSRAWGVNGMVNRQPGQGSQYFLSTVLAVTRNFGTSEQEALEQLQSSVLADETNPLGTFYFSLGKGVRNTTRKSQIKPAVAALTAMGKQARTIETNFPEAADDVVGLMTGTAGFDFSSTGSRILPGAICDHLTSYGGRLAVPGQTKLSEFIRHGAAGASGTVTEPYALAAKFPHAMMHVHYARGCSLAESFYQSVAGPFQLLIVGDALCQPFAVKPKVSVVGLAPMQEVAGTVSIKFDTKASQAPIAMLEIYVDGVLFFRNFELEPMKFDSSSLADGFHELRAVVTSNDLIESTGHTIVPFVVNNRQQQIELKCDRQTWQETEDILVMVESNVGQSVIIAQNMRSLAQQIRKGQGTRSFEFTIPAKQLGRGPVQLTAVASSDDHKLQINSRPLNLNIEGSIASERINTERPKPPAG